MSVSLLVRTAIGTSGRTHLSAARISAVDPSHLVARIDRTLLDATGLMAGAAPVRISLTIARRHDRGRRGRYVRSRSATSAVSRPVGSSSNRSGSA